jgi:hypothetical protein
MIVSFRLDERQHDEASEKRQHGEGIFDHGVGSKSVTKAAVKCETLSSGRMIAIPSLIRSMVPVRWRLMIRTVSPGLSVVVMT